MLPQRLCSRPGPHLSNGTAALGPCSIANTCANLRLLQPKTASSSSAAPPNLLRARRDGPLASGQQRPVLWAAAAPEGFDAPTGSSDHARNGAKPVTSMYTTDTYTTALQSISFAEPSVQTGTSDGYGSSNRQGQHYLGSGSSSGKAGPSHAAALEQHSSMHYHAAPPSPQPSLLNSYSDYYRQQQQQQHSSLAEAQTDAPSSSAPEPPSNGAALPATPTPSSDADAAAASALSVAEALSRAQQALDKVESSLDAIDQLPSARQNPESRVSQALQTLRTIVAVGALSAALLASHAFGLVYQWLFGVLASAALGTYAYRKGSLSWSGAIAAFCVGLGTLGCSLRLGVTLLAFFFSSSKLTQYKEELKMGLDDQAKKGGQRDWVQVCCNALVPTILAVVYGVLAGCVDVPLGPLPSLEEWRAKAVTALLGGFLGYYACCCGDTWASELGPLSTDTPRLITTLRPVRKGTNGGVTLLGLSASILGGAFIGATFYAAAVVSPTLFIFEARHMVAIEQWKLLPLGLVAGLLGSVLDSVLGATLQYSGYNPATGRVTSRPGPGVQHISGSPLLSNNAVNAVSASLTAAVTALAALKAFGF